VQFAILFGFVIAATVIYQQKHYATRESLRADIDQIFGGGQCYPGARG
jgi:hypothetical protein